jgi:tetratricopeptide (TPR) repeat protein
MSYFYRAILTVVVLGLGLSMGAYFLYMGDRTNNTPEVFSTDPWNDCRQTDNFALIIAGCTALIAYGETDPAKLADAYLLRGRANANLMKFAEARADYDQSIQVLPINSGALQNRAILSENENRYESALADYELALTQAKAFHGPNPTQEALSWQNILQQGATRLRQRVDLEVRWRSYLAGIQQQDDYANWSGPPSDLYWRHHEQP